MWVAVSELLLAPALIAWGLKTSAAEVNAWGLILPFLKLFIHPSDPAWGPGRSPT